MNKFFASKKFKAVIGILNICLIIGLASYLIVSFVSRNSGSSTTTITAESYSVDDPESAMADAEDKMMNTYSILLGGCTAKLSDDKVMYFGVDGSFEGFFDDENPDVSGYTFEAVSLDEGESDYVANVNIYNKDKTSYVQYKLYFGTSENDNAEDTESSMCLFYPKTEQVIALEF